MSEQQNFSGVRAKQGWQCPNCRRIYSPEMTECVHCNKQCNRGTWGEVPRAKSTSETISASYPPIKTYQYQYKYKK